MIVFRYDKTFEGLLTAVFDAYARREFPDVLLSADDPGPLFVASSHTVVTGREEAARVWAGLRRHVSGYACNMIMYGWLSEEPGCDGLLFRYMRKVFDSSGAIAANFSDPDVLELKQLAMKVGREGEYVRQFLRFQEAGDGSYFAAMAPKYNALPLAIEHLKDRFADQKWLVYDTGRRYGYYYDLKTVEEVTMEDDAHLISGRLAEELMSADEAAFQALWKGYFKAVAIKERLNPRLHARNMPRRFWKYLTEKQ